MSVLAVSRLRKSFDGIEAVRDVSFTVAAGEMLALIGPNGAGKSTCFNMVGGQLRPDGGSVRLGGREIAGLSPRAIWRLGVGRTFQVAATFASMTVRENVQMALLSRHGRVWRSGRAASKYYIGQAEGLLGRLGMAEQSDRAAGLLAYGDLKRLELAMALAHQPRLLLMDEPTAGMAAAERTAMMRLVLARGALIAEGDAAAIRADVRVREAYLGTSYS